VFIANISIYVHDLDRAMAFYKDALKWVITANAPMGKNRWVTVAPAHEKTSFLLVHGFGDWAEEKIGGLDGHRHRGRGRRARLPTAARARRRIRRTAAP
jgi:predicted enzyme related to lactoylglutathione lyase